jgi:hypothetical protein
MMLNYENHVANHFQNKKEKGSHRHGMLSKQNSNWLCKRNATGNHSTNYKAFATNRLQLQFWPSEGTPSNTSVIKVLSTHTHTDMESYAPIVWDIKEPHIETGTQV